MTPDYAIHSLAFMGLMVSLYVVWVEQKLEAKEAGYQPLCDAKSLGISCSKVFTSDAGHLLSYVGLLPRDSPLNVSNGTVGVLFYSTVYMVTHLSNYLPLALRVYATFALILASIGTSLVLGYAMVKDLHEICIVCSFVHLINLFSFIWAVRWVRDLWRRNGTAPPVRKQQQ
jgi:uncharacterized membrane protein